MLGRRRGRWANIEPTLGQRIVFAGIPSRAASVHLSLKNQHR